MFENNAMLYFKGISGFKKYLKEINVYGGWKIESGLMNDRGKLIDKKNYVAKLRNQFNKKKLFYKSVSISEIVTWLDTFVHITRIIEQLEYEIEKSILNQIEIIFEYVIEMSKMARVDVIFKYKYKMCLMEFSLVNGFNRMRRAYEKKRIELMIYKDLMRNYISEEYKIIVFPFIALFEYSDKTDILKHIESNEKQACFAAEYLAKYVINTYEICNDKYL